MYKLLVTTAAVAGETDFGTFTDTRDGQTYKTVKIGEQTWMAQNLNYKTKDGSWCYDNKADNCKQYGRLYDWKTAKTVCPNGWKLPDTADWNRLVLTAGEKGLEDETLKAKSGWKEDCDGNKNCNGTDNYGFSALPGGYRDDDGSFEYAGYDGNWWTATEMDDIYVYTRNMKCCSPQWGSRVKVDGYYESYGLSVRCVADRP